MHKSVESIVYLNSGRFFIFMQKLKLFAITSSVFLFLELFAPFAFAQSFVQPAAQPLARRVQPVLAQARVVSLQAGASSAGAFGAYCRVAEMTPQEVQSLWANTLGFSPNEINFLELGEALKNMQEAGKHRFPPSTQAAVIGTEEVSLSQVAGILGVSEQQAARDLRLKEYCESLKKEDVKPCLDKYFDDKGRVKSTATIPLSTAEKYAQQVGKPKNFVVQQLQKMGLLPGGGLPGLKPEEKPEKCVDLKIAVAGGTPGQNEVSLCDLFKAQKMKPEQCALDNENIQGRVTYYALLDKDLNYCPDNTKQCAEGIYYSSASGDKVDELDSEQHLLGKEITGYLNLGNEGANVIIPSFYEDWIIFSGKWNSIDFWVSTILGVTAFAYSKEVSGELAKAQEKQKTYQELFDKISNKDVQRFQFIQHVSNAKNALDDQIKRIPIGNDIWTANGFTSSTAYEKKLGEVLEKINQDTPAAEVIRLKLLNGETVITSDELKALGITPPPKGNFILDPQHTQVQEVARALDENIKVSNELKASSDQLHDAVAEVQSLGKDLQGLQKLGSYASRRALLGLIVGAGWLGPARYLYSVNNRIFISLKATTPSKDAFVKVYANREVAAKFRDATDMFAVGRFTEALSQYFGSTFTVPAKAFQASKILLVNAPTGTDSKSSTTRISFQDGLKISTDWSGDSYSTNFEDISSFSSEEKFSSLPLKLQNTFPNAVINKQDAGIIYSYILTLAPQFIIARSLSTSVSAPTILGVATFLLVNDVIVSFDPFMYKGQECDKKKLSTYKWEYGAATAAGWLSYLVIPSLSAFKLANLKKISFISKIAKSTAVSRATNLVNTLNLPLAVQWGVGSNALNYASSCADPEYKILAYQKLPEPVKKKASGVAEKLQPITDVLSQLGIGTAAQQAFEKKENPLAKMTEILNFKAGLKDQRGFIQPEALYYIQIEKSAFSTKSGLFDQLARKGCPFVENYQSGDKTARLSATEGVALYDKNGNSLEKFDSDDWKLRALGRLLSQENGRVILPNKLLEANTAGCSGILFNVFYDGRISFGTSCSAFDCLKRELSVLTKRPVGDDLTPFLGSVSTVVTDSGVASISGNEISFTRVSPTSGKVGTEITAPSIEDKNSLKPAQLLGSSLQVESDGRVFLSGPSGSTVSGQEIGFLKTIIGSKGKIEFDAASKHLFLFVYVIAGSSAQAVKDFSLVGTAKNADGSTTPKLSVTEKTGMETGLQQALQQIQGTGGMQSFETKDHIYAFTKDANGNPILRVIDKKTGQATDYRITGEPYRDANGNLVVPTDKGNFVFGFKQGPDGGPWLEAKGPGLEEFLPLLAARGQNGILTFNPTTGAINVYNGQDIPLSPEFAQKGIAFSGDAAGNARGVPQDNFFAPPAPAASQGGGVSPLVLPSWPRELTALIAMLAVLAVSVVLVRLKFSRNQGF